MCGKRASRLASSSRCTGLAARDRIFVLACRDGPQLGYQNVNSRGSGCVLPIAPVTQRRTGDRHYVKADRPSIQHWSDLLEVACDMRQRSVRLFGVPVWGDHGLVRVLVTGDGGSVGVPVAGFLRRAGYEVAGFDGPAGRTSWTWQPSGARPGAVRRSCTWQRWPTTAPGARSRSWPSTCWAPGMCC